MASRRKVDLHWHKSSTRSFFETIVFTHHFGGSHSSTKRHQELVKELGFDCVSFDLDCQWRPSFKTSFRNHWMQQIENALDQISGPKILYTFSSPSASSLGAIVDRGDVDAWICDGGPFFEAYECLKNYYRYQTKLSPVAYDLATAISYVLMGCFGYESQVKKWLSKLPKDFPILSIRAGQDKLVPVRAIDAFFASVQTNNFEKFEISEAEHLEGLKNFPNLYKPRVKEFLLKHAHAISN